MVFHYFKIVDNLVSKCGKLNISPFLHPLPLFSHPAALPVRQSMGSHLMNCSQEISSPSVYCRPYLGWGRSESLRAVSRRGRWLCRGRTERVAAWHRSQETAAALPAWRLAAQAHLCNAQVTHSQKELMGYPSLNLHLLPTIWDNRMVSGETPG